MNILRSYMYALYMGVGLAAILPEVKAAVMISAAVSLAVRFALKM